MLVPPPIPHVLPVPQEVNRLILKRDAEVATCTECRVAYACPQCGKPAPDPHKHRTAFQCQHVLWTTMVTQQGQQAQQPQQQGQQPAAQQQAQPSWIQRKR